MKIRKSPKMAYRLNRADIARRILDGWSVKDIHGELTEAGAIIGYATLASYVRKDEWDGLPEEINVDDLRNITSPVVRGRIRTVKATVEIFVERKGDEILDLDALTNYVATAIAQNNLGCYPPDHPFFGAIEARVGIGKRVADSRGNQDNGAS